MNPFTAHPNSVGETYAQHLRFALPLRREDDGWAASLRSSTAILPFLLRDHRQLAHCDELIAMLAASRGRTVRVVDAATMQPLDYHTRAAP